MVPRRTASTSRSSPTGNGPANGFGKIFRFDVEHPQSSNNDRLKLSKGDASPLFYSLWAAAGEVSESELLTFRKLGSPLEGHANITFPYAEAATASLGQGLSIGLGMALDTKYLDELPYRTYVLLGDSEMAEVSQLESIQKSLSSPPLQSSLPGLSIKFKWPSIQIPTSSSSGPMPEYPSGKGNH